MEDSYYNAYQKEMEILNQDPMLKAVNDMAEGEGTLVARTFFAPFVYEIQGKKIVTTFPQHGFNRTFNEADLGNLMFKIVEEVKRIRNYLAFVSGYSFQFNYIMASRHFRIPELLEGKHFLEPSIFLHDKRNEAEKKLKNSIKLSYSTTDILLKKIEAGSDYNRFISLIGFSISSNESEHSFLSLWKAIEIAADIQFKEEIKEVGDFKIISEYLPSFKLKKLVEGKSVTLTSIDKISVAITKIRSDFPLSELKQIQNLRNKLVHSSIEPHELKEITQFYPKLYDLAQKLAYSLLVRNEIIKEAEETLKSCKL